MGLYTDQCKTLDEWTEKAELEEFRDKHVKIHLKAFGIKESDIDIITRLIMISLRQEIYTGWRKK